MTTPYQRARVHENKIRKIDEVLGRQGTRSAGSHGLVDVITWNTEDIIFYVVREEPFHPNYKEMIKRELKMPPHSKLIFVWKENGYERREIGKERL